GWMWSTCGIVVHWTTIGYVDSAASHGGRDARVHCACRQTNGRRGSTALIDYLARNPTAGDLIPGTGGVRKLRWGLEGRGKRGGARVIYFYHGVVMPLFLLSAYAKNERADLSYDDRRGFKHMTQRLFTHFFEQ